MNWFRINKTTNLLVFKNKQYDITSISKKDINHKFDLYYAGPPLGTGTKFLSLLKILMLS